MGSFYPNSNMVPLPDAAPDDQSPGGGNEGAGGAPAPEGSERATEPPVAGRPDDDYAPNVPDNVKELRKGTLYDPDSTFANDLKIDNAELPPEQVQAVTTELRRMAGDVGLSSPEVREFVEIARGISSASPSDEQQNAWRDEAEKALASRYGANAHEALNLARALVQRDPRLATLIDVRGMGNHPRVVAALVERAYSERKAGRL